MQVVQHQGLTEVRREFVFGLTLGRINSRPATSVGDELPLLIVDGYHDATVHDTAASMIPDTKRGNRLVGKSLLHKVGMRRIQAPNVDASGWFGGVSSASPVACASFIAVSGAVVASSWCSVSAALGESPAPPAFDRIRGLRLAVVFACGGEDGVISKDSCNRMAACCWSLVRWPCRCPLLHTPNQSYTPPR